MKEAETFKAALRSEKPADELEQAYRQGYMQGRKECDPRIIRIAEHYGYEAQREQLEEECAEAILAIQKVKRSCSAERFANLVEEVADVLIMAQQMRYLISPGRIDRIIDEKLNRQLRRIESET